MEKGIQIPAPPYPGPPLDYNAGVSQQGYQQSVQPVVQPIFQPVVQPIVQPVIQPVVQPVVQPFVQPVIQTVQQHHIIQPVNQVNQVVVVQNLPKCIPGQMACPYCHTSVVTKIEYKIGPYTWLVCGLLAVFLCWPCCFIPFCVNDCKDVEHSCPSCNGIIHVHRRM
ncbi:lipopolysaccharide-induced tumor necrosis factor-alpha factor homolog [Oreochromis aureus]|uniref:LITAF domain-containing protein n=1 Tax=Oreochromis aureus TaxID=47969 RepID=A0AAZ1XF99_OREAU|nr:lipopolysaccharide-induced tumor necrosis factor-alpha factor homolog [Oreochromis aureus]